MRINKKKLVSSSAVVLVLLVIIGAIAGSPSKKHHIASTSNATAGTPPTTASVPQSAPTSAPSTQATTTVAAPPKLKPYQRPASFYIDITASVAGQHIHVGGRTNLPDGTILTLNAERDFKQTHDAERVDFLGLNGPTQANVPVHAGHFSGELSVQEHDLSAMQGDPGGPVATVDPDADVCVVLYTGRDETVNGPWRQPPRCGLTSAPTGSSCAAVLASGPSGRSRSTRRSTSLLRPESLDPSALVSGLAAQQTLTPQAAPLPNICSA